MKKVGSLLLNLQGPKTSAKPNRRSGLAEGYQAHSKTRGQAIVEFALAIPFIFMLTFGVIEFGRMMFSYSMVVTAAREAARFGSAVDNYQNCAGIQAAAERIGGMAGVQASHVSISYDDGFGGNVRSCPPGVLPLGSRVIVSVHDVPYMPVLPMVNLPSISLRSEARRTILIGLELR